MSASLVGSEMCIRDSMSRVPKLRMLCRVERPCAGAGADENAPSASCPPVSYTHLTLPTICSV
eukprot:10213689-Alexandrium_andersonii.AAC.1